MEEEPIKNGEKKERDEKGRFTENYSGGPGRPIGVRNFDTLFEEAIRKIAQDQRIEIKNPETEMAVKAIVEALKGNFPFFRDLMDRRYGRAKQPIDFQGEVEMKIISIDE